MIIGHSVEYFLVGVGFVAVGYSLLRLSAAERSERRAPRTVWYLAVAGFVVLVCGGVVFAAALISLIDTLLAR